ncbi:MAG: Uma2 family endonuclease [Verrucomicrobia bacterium]|nr:Uma2 family endonuclease [Verrucomicrobiota bacterium]
MNLPRDGYKYELLNGELIVSPAGFDHGDVCTNVSTELKNYVRARRLGKVCDGQTGFRVRRGVKRKTLLSPDVSFVAQARVEAAASSLKKFFAGAPDLAVEVLSPKESLASAERKIRLLFRNGARLGWIVDPAFRRVHVLTPDGPATVKHWNESLDGGAVVPGLRVRVRRFFE